MMKQPQPAADDARANLRTAFKVIALLGALVVGLVLALAWTWWRLRAGGPTSGLVLRLSTGENLIRKKFPEVDFAAVYPGRSPAEIDEVQRESLALRYVYAPFVEFAPLPTEGRWLNITPAGFRKGRTGAPWPPARDDVVVFVFGGSTALGFGVPDADTVASALEDRLGARFPGHRVRCYNFGRGYYFSTQERLLFESLLTAGMVPNYAVFIDGLNEFVYYDGMPQLEPELFHFTAPERPLPRLAEPATDAERAAAVAQLIARYRENIRLTEGVARAFGVTPVFVGQPVPFLDFPMQPATYPFRSTFAEERLAGWGYDRFKQAARDGQFGDHFVWCGNAFAGADRIMYVDSIHYSRAGAELLAGCLVERAAQVGLWP